MKKVIVIIVAAIVIVAIGLFAFVQVNSGPVDSDNTDQVTVTVPQGAGTNAIAEELSSKDLIQSELVFKLKSRLAGNDGQYKSGGYLISQSMSMDEIMDVLISGETEVSRFTIPEGYNIQQTMDVLVEQGLVTEEDFMEEVRNGDFDYEFLEGLEPSDSRLEGYLYPETYDVYDGASAHDIIDRMLSQFDMLYTEEYRERTAELGLSISEVVNLASIIEKESVAAEERPIMAAVFYNRMEIDMPLQSCATIQYILGEPKPHLSIADTQIESPYNTYINDGLPPAPICSPRIQSIEAALYPDDNDYIFFVLKPDLDGTHNFSESYDEFLKDKAAYDEAVRNG